MTSFQTLIANRPNFFDQTIHILTWNNNNNKNLVLHSNNKISHFMVVIIMINYKFMLLRSFETIIIKNKPHNTYQEMHKLARFIDSGEEFTMSSI